METVGKEVHIVPMSGLLWSALDKVYERDNDEGLEAVIELEKERGYVEAQQQVTTYLSSRVWIPLWELLAERFASINPENSVVFLTRVAAMSPGIFPHLDAPPTRCTVKNQKLRRSCSIPAPSKARRGCVSWI